MSLKFYNILILKLNFITDYQGKIYLYVRFFLYVFTFFLQTTQKYQFFSFSK